MQKSKKMFMAPLHFVTPLLEQLLKERETENACPRRAHTVPCLFAACAVVVLPPAVMERRKRGGRGPASFFRSQTLGGAAARDARGWPLPHGPPVWGAPMALLPRSACLMLLLPLPGSSVGLLCCEVGCGGGRRLSETVPVPLVRRVLGEHALGLRAKLLPQEAALLRQL